MLIFPIAALALQPPTEIAERVAPEPPAVVFSGALLVGQPQSEAGESQMQTALYALAPISAEIALGGALDHSLEGGGCGPSAAQKARSCLRNTVSLRPALGWQLGGWAEVGGPLLRVSLAVGPAYQRVDEIGGAAAGEPGWRLASSLRVGAHFEVIRAWGGGFQPGVVAQISTLDTETPVLSLGVALDGVVYE